MTRHDLIKTLTPDAIMAELGVTESSIKEAARKGLPARWFDGIDRLCEGKGIRTPREHFNWRTRDTASDEAAA